MRRIIVEKLHLQSAPGLISVFHRFIIYAVICILKTPPTDFPLQNKTAGCIKM